jgi:hypothetical protein
MRGRNNNQNRKGPNPLTRNYESNGPDVKIRGSAQQIAEKYAALARDAMSSGDRVMAENYLQHAEHYNRIIAAAQAQMPIQNFQQHSRDDFDDESDEDRDDFDSVGNAADVPVPVVNHGAGPQPVIEGTPAEVALDAEGGRENRDHNGGRRHHRDRRPNGGYGPNGQRNDFRSDRGNQGQRPEDQPRAEVAAAPEQPVAQPASENLSPADLAARADQNGEQTGGPRRGRRPRRGRPNAGQTAEGDEGNADQVGTAEAEGGEPAAASAES